MPSGIPDFRSPGTGLWENVNPIEVAHISVFERDPQRFWSYYRPRFGMLAEKQPNGAHLALADLERRGMLAAVVTQNIDLLHSRAGSQRVVEVHGSIQTSSCWRCTRQAQLEEIEELFDAEGVPRCRSCAGPLKPDVVLFGETLPEAAIEAAFELAGRAELLLCVGSSLEVQPVATLPAITKRAGGKVAVITKGETPYDADADVRLDGEVVTDLEAVLELLHQD